LGTTDIVDDIVADVRTPPVISEATTEGQIPELYETANEHLGLYFT